LAASGSVEMMEEFASRKMTGVDPLMKNVAGKTPRDVFDTRVDKANEEPIVAFKQLLASVNATSEEDAGQDEQDDEVGKGDDFHDALEAQTDEAEMH
jgi:hypothetical protein